MLPKLRIWKLSSHLNFTPPADIQLASKCCQAVTRIPKGEFFSAQHFAIKIIPVKEKRLKKKTQIFQLQCTL